MCRVLCSTVKELVARLAAQCDDDRCVVLNEKLDALITTLHDESQAAGEVGRHLM